MYFIEDKVGAIKEVQKMLGVNETGTFDDNTRNTVISLQKKNDLSVTGVVDYETFLIILDNYRKRMLIDRVRSSLPFPNGFPYKRGDFNDSIGVLNSMLSLSIDKYCLKLFKPKGNYYSQRTENAVKTLRKIFLLEDKNEIDEEFYEKLQRQHQSRINIEEKSRI